MIQLVHLLTVQSPDILTYYRRSKSAREAAHPYMLDYEADVLDASEVDSAEDFVGTVDMGGSDCRQVLSGLKCVISGAEELLVECVVQV